jgi:hypothetical protein
MAILDITGMDDETKKKIFKELTSKINQDMIKAIVSNTKMDDYYCLNFHSLKINQFIEKKDGPFDPADYEDPIELTLK